MSSQSEPFEHHFIVRLHDTDAAGLLFFGHLFRHAHDAYESFMTVIGFPLERLIRDGQTRLPLAHAEADYRLPLRHGDPVRVWLRVATLRRRSFAIDYRFINAGDEVAATARTVHVLVGSARLDPGEIAGEQRPGKDAAAIDALPPALRTALSAYLPEDAI